MLFSVQCETIWHEGQGQGHHAKGQGKDRIWSEPEEVYFTEAQIRAQYGLTPNVQLSPQWVNLLMAAPRSFNPLTDRWEFLLRRPGQNRVSREGKGPGRAVVGHVFSSDPV